MPAPLAEDARKYLQAQGAPISEYNIKQAMRELQADPSLRPSYSSDNQMVSAMGGVTGQPDRSGTKYPPMQPQKGSNIGQHANDPDFVDPGYVPGPGSQTSSSQFTDVSRQGQGGNANQSRRGQGGNAGGAPTTTNRPGGVATDNNTSATAPIPKVTQSELTRGEVNQLAKPRPASMGAGTGGNEQVAANAPPSPSRPPVSPGVTAPNPANTATVQGPQPSVPASPSGPTGALNPSMASGSPLVQPGTRMPLPPPTGGFPSPLIQPGTPMPMPPPAGGFPPAAPQPGMLDQIMGMLPEGTAQRAGNVAAIGGPILGALLAARGGGAPLAGAGGGMRPRNAPLLSPEAALPVSPPGGLPGSGMAPMPPPPPPALPPPGPQMVGRSFTPTPDVMTPPAQQFPRLPPTPSGMTVSDAMTTHVGRTAPPAPAPAPKAAPKKPARGEPKNKREENKARTSRRKARTRGDQK